MAGEVVVLARRLDTHARPELCGLHLAEARGDIVAVDVLGREARRAVLAHERHQQLGHVVAGLVEHAHGVEDEDLGHRAEDAL